MCVASDATVITVPTGMDMPLENAKGLRTVRPITTVREVPDVSTNMSRGAERQCARTPAYTRSERLPDERVELVKLGHRCPSPSVLRCNRLHFFS
jgi:hypothetical protein